MVDHGAGGVVQGGERVHILRVPAAVFEAARDADLVSGAVEDTGDVLVIDRDSDVFPHGLKNLAVSLAQTAQLCRLEAAQA